MRDQHRVRHGDRDDALQPDTYELQVRAFAAQQGVFAVNRRGRACGDNPPRVRRAFPPDRLPPAKIGPSPAIGHHCQIAGLFHDRIVDGDRVGPIPGRGVQPQKTQVRLCIFKGRPDGGKHRGLQSFSRLDQGGSLEQKYPGVPQKSTRGQHRLGPCDIRLFDKVQQRLRHRRKIISWRGRQFQPAIAGLCPIRPDAEGHDLPCLCRMRCCAHGRAEPHGIRDHMIRRGHQHQRPGDLCLQRKSSSDDGGAGVARGRFDQDHRRINAGRCQLLGHDEAEVRPCHHHGPGKSRPRQPACRGAKQRVGPQKLCKLLGIAFPAQRPKPCARTAAQQHGMDQRAGA